MMGFARSLWVKVAVVLALSVPLLLFQNCQRAAMNSEGSQAPQQNQSQNEISNDGFPIEGKVYFEAERRCPDGENSRTRIRYDGPGAATVLRENCAAVTPPRAIGASEFYVPSYNTDLLVYQQARTLVAEVPRYTTIQFREYFSNYLNGNAAVQTVGLTGGQNPPAAGNLLTCFMSYESGTASVASVTDTAGNTFRRAIGPVNGDFIYQNTRVEAWYAENTVAGAAGYQVTVNYSISAGGQKSVACYEYTGVLRSNSLISARSAFGSPGGNQTVSLPAMQTTGNSLIVVSTLGANSSSAVEFFERNALVNVHIDKFVYGAGTHLPTVNLTNLPSYVSVQLIFGAQSP